jgi:hypothetical protein
MRRVHCDRCDANITSWDIFLLKIAPLGSNGQDLKAKIMLELCTECYREINNIINHWLTHETQTREEMEKTVAKIG